MAFFANHTYTYVAKSCPDLRDRADKQASTTPKPQIIQKESDLRYLYVPLEDNISGDLILSATTPSGRRYILLGDFTGHGSIAAQGAPYVSRDFYQMTLADKPIEEILNHINKYLKDNYETDYFLAAGIIEYTPTTHAVRIVNAGLPDVLIFRNDQVIHQFKSTKLPLGIIQVQEGFYTFTEPTIFAPGDKTMMVLLRTEPTISPY